jgi:glycopeptide antibiotics resistance protein
MRNRLTYILSIIYLIALFWIIVFKLSVSFHYSGTMKGFNLVPFSAPMSLNGKIDYGEMILNIFVFVPMGIYVGILFKRWIITKKALLFFLVSLLCETLQYIYGVGAFDITDIINNTLGGIIGLIIYKTIEKLFRNDDKSQQFINILAAIGTVLMISLLLFLRINNLWIFRMNTIHRTITSI